MSPPVLPDAPLSRRDFLRYTSLGTIGIGLARSRGLTEEPKDERWKMPYRPLGQTGLKLSEVSLVPIALHQLLW